MKKLGLSMLVMLCGFFAITIAQNFDLGYVDLNFCDGENQLHMQSDAGLATGFCMVFTNLSPITGNIKVLLVDGEMSVGEHPVKACKTTSDGYFAKFVTLSGVATGNTIILPPNSGVVQQGIINVPNGFVGVLNGCITFTIQDGSSESTGMFQIVNRKANIIDITVSGSYVNGFGFLDMQTFSGEKWVMGPTTKTLSTDMPILVTQDNAKNIKLVLGLQNTGFVDENYTISGTIYNTYFGKKFYTENINIGSGILYGQDTVVIEYPIISLPFYKGRYYIDIDITHTPVLATGVVATNTGDITQHMIQNISVMVYPEGVVLLYVLIPIGVVCSVVIVLIMRKKRSSKKKSK